MARFLRVFSGAIRDMLKLLPFATFSPVERNLSTRLKYLMLLLIMKRTAKSCLVLRKCLVVIIPMFTCMHLNFKTV